MGELKCLSCHVVGKLGPNQDSGERGAQFPTGEEPAAPGLDRRWLQNPNALQEGHPDAELLGLLRSGASDDELQVVGGDAKAQIEALRDLLMHLGEPGYARRAPARGAGRTRG